MSTLLAQAPAAKTAAAKEAWTTPRLPDGKPDLQGIWTNGTVTPLERPKNLGAKEFYTDEEYAKLMSRIKEEGEVGEEGELGAARRGNALRFDLELYGFDVKKTSFASNKRTSLIVGPEGRIPPMLQEAEPGEYRLWSTGEVVVDPDYFARFTWKKSPNEQNERPA